MKDNSKVLGVIGGMGPLATQLFYKMIIEHTDAHRDQDHINMIVLNHATMPDRTTAIMEDTLEELLVRLIEDARLLESGGADFLVIPCNTCHVLAEKLQKATAIPMINMIDVTADQVAEKYGQRSRVGIMATDGTIKMGLYQCALEKRGLIPIVLSKEHQSQVMKIIYEGIKDNGPIDYKQFEKIEKAFKDAGCDCVIMACTELSCFKEMYQLSDYYIDAMEVMAQQSIVSCGKRIRRKHQ